MKYKKILIATFFLLAILTVGAVSASEYGDVSAQDSQGAVGQDNVIDDELKGNSTVDTNSSYLIDDEITFDDELEGNSTVDTNSSFDDDEDDPQFDIKEEIDTENGEVFGLLLTQEQLDNRLGSGIIEVVSSVDDVFLLQVNVSELEFESYGDGIIGHYFTLSDLNNFSGLSDGDQVIFGLWQYEGDEAPWIEKKREITFTESIIYLNRLGDYDDAVLINDYANIIDSDTWIIDIDPNLLPQYLNDDWMINITVDIWGHTKKTTWNSSLLEKNDNDCFIFTVSDLSIDKIMQDISSDAECEICVQIYDDEHELDPYEGTCNLYTNPYISSGELTFEDSIHDPSTQANPVISFTGFDYFKEEGFYDEFTITSTSDKGSISKNFNMNQMDGYLEVYWDVEYYNLYLDDLGITELGSYDVSIKFDSDEGSIYYNGSFEAVSFRIDVLYCEDGSEDLVDVVTLSIFRIVLPANTTDKARVYLNGTKIIDKSLADIGITTNPMGREDFAIHLNDLQITESGKYNVKLEVLDENDQLLRNVSTNIWVVVSNNSIEFKDILYFDEDYAEVFLGASVSQIGDIVLLLNGQKAGVGAFNDIFGMIFELDDDFTNPHEENILIPGHYEAQAILVSPNGNQTLGEGSFSVLDDSGAVEIDVFANGTAIYLQIKGSMPDYDMEGQDLTILVDPDYDYSDDDEGLAFFEYAGDVLEELLDNELHAIYLGDFEQGSHIVRVEYRTHNDDIPIEDQDYFLRMFNVTVGDAGLIDTVISASKVTADYNSGKKISATLKDADGNPIKGANVEISVGDIDEILTTNSNGRVYLSTDGLNPGEYDAVITYAGDSTYASSTKTIKVVINKIPTNISVIYDDVDMEIVAVLTNGATGQAIKGANVRFIIDGTKYSVKTNSNGQAEFSTANLDGGNHIVTVSYDGNSKYSPSNASIEFTAKVATNLTLDYDNGAREVVATLINGATGQAIKNANVRFVVDGVKYTVKSDANGQAKVSVSSLAMDTYQATASYNGNSKYSPSDVAIDFTITKIITSVSMYYDAGTNELVATLVNAETGKAISGATLVFNVNGVKTSAKTDKQGQARFTPAGVDLDNFNAGISYGGNSKYLKSTGSIKIIAGKISTCISNSYDKQAQEVTATLTNNQTGQFIKGATVVFNVNGVKTSFKTDALGQVKISVAGLDLGTNSIGSSYGGNSKYAGSTTGINIIKI